MARKDLAGIAALAGLGMLMANKGKKGSMTERQMAADKDANETQSMEDDSGMDPEEAANKRTERMLKPNERGAPGTSETVFPSTKHDCFLILRPYLEISIFLENSRKFDTILIK